MNGADVVAEILRREGTDFLSAYPRNPLIESCAALNIRPIFCRQERVGVGLADGYSRIKRGKKNGVFAAQAGPGIENAFPGVAQAYTENVPMLMIPAGLPLSKHYVKPTFRAADVYRPVTKWSALAHNVQELPDLMRRAYQALRSGKPGPVMVEVPNEIFEAEFKGEIDYIPVPVQRTAPDPDAIKEAARMLLAAKNPVLWAGQGIHYAEAGDLLAALAELIPAPVVATNPGKSAIPDSHPLALGGSTRSRSKMFTEFMAKADVVMAIGSSLTKTEFRSQHAARQDRSSTPPTMPSDINKECRASALGGRRRRARDRSADRRGREAEGRRPRRQRARLAQGGDRVGEEGVARGMGEASRFRRDAAEPVPRDPRSHAHHGPRQRHHHPRLRLAARATAAVLGDHQGRLLHGLGQVHAARLRARHHHRREARGAERSSAST